MPARLARICAPLVIAAVIVALVLAGGDVSQPAAQVVAAAPAGVPAGRNVEATPSATAEGVRIGIGDQKVDMFSDPRFKALHIADARLNVGWDALEDNGQRAKIDAWLNAARAAGVDPLISFGHSLTNRRSLPTPERMKFEFRQFRARYPWVFTFATWNEANHCGEPTCHRPALVAAYYRVMRAECPGCTVLAAELLDTPNADRWARDYIRSLHFSPSFWGLHNYIEANRFTTVRLRSLLRQIGSAQLWLTETGGIVSRHNNSTTKIPQGPAHAGQVTRFIFDRIVPSNPRIKRVYLYEWNAHSASDGWDSALITPGGTPRASYYVLQRVLKSGPRLNAKFPAPINGGIAPR